MRKFIITYSYPAKYRGSYEVVVEDSIFASMNASKKVQQYLEEKHGKADDSHSIVMEIYGEIQTVK